jgi:hypothetical protein
MLDTVAALEVGGREQVRHQLDDVHAVERGREARGASGARGRSRPQVLDHRQLLRAHLARDLLETFEPDTW